MKASWETWESDFLEKKWCNEGENASGRREWIVTMEEERRVKREKHKKKKRQMRMGAKNSPPPPPPFSDQSCWVNSSHTHTQKKKKRINFSSFCPFFRK